MSLQVKVFLSHLSMCSHARMHVLSYLMMFLLCSALWLNGCSPAGDSNADRNDLVESEIYRKAFSDFTTALAASETDEARFAFNKMNDVVLAFPEEASAWGNLGMMAMRQGNLELAQSRISKALETAPNHPDILHQAAILESRNGNTSKSIELLVRANRLQTDAKAHVDAQAHAHTDAIIPFMLVTELERDGSDASFKQAVTVLDSLLATRPDNMVLQYEALRLASAASDWQGMQDRITWFTSNTTEWPEDAVQSLRKIQHAVDKRDLSVLPLEISLLLTYLQPSERFQMDTREVRLPPDSIGFLIQEFIHLPKPVWRALPPDTLISFEPAPLRVGMFPDTLAIDQASKIQWIDGVRLFRDDIPFPVVMDNRMISITPEIQLPVPETGDGLIGKHSVLFVDADNDFQMDVIMAGSEGVSHYRQTENRQFEEATDLLSLPDRDQYASYRSVWSYDLDMDGDLDLILSPANRSPFVLRNLGLGRFERTDTFSTLPEITDFYWADLDGDGPPEAIVRTALGEVHVLWNMRGGQFSDPVIVRDRVMGLTIADLNANGAFQLIVLDEHDEERTVRSLELSNHQKTRDADVWQVVNLISSVDFFIDTGLSPELFAADLDNNGALDLLIQGGDTRPASSQSEDYQKNLPRAGVWLTDETFQFRDAPLLLEGGTIVSLFDVEGDDRLDLLMIRDEGGMMQMDNQGSAGYFGTTIRAEASGDQGDQRINSFGIGGEIEVRSAFLYQKQMIQSPLVHLGLGDQENADVLRIIWPNGSVQTGFSELGAGSTILNEQILKGSCPWLFTHDGESFRFVTDVLWRSPLGLRINAAETAGILQTFDRVRIPPDALQAVQGIYDLRITAELWETHFFDHAALLAVDHPEHTHVWIDERFVFPPPDLGLRLTGELSQVAQITARKKVFERGNLMWSEWFDISAELSDQDAIYAMPFEKSPYQGLVRDHEIIVDLRRDESPETLPSDMLVLSGWLRPTDSSLNLALSQGLTAPPAGLKVHVDRGEGWELLHENYGIPAGKLKTILLDLPVTSKVGSSANGGRSSTDSDISKIKNAAMQNIQTLKSPQVAKHLPSTREKPVLRVKLTTSSEIYWDRIAQTRSLPSSMLTQTYAHWTRTDLQYRGYSEWSRKDSLSPKTGDYNNISGTRQRWRDLQGFHTRFGDVAPLLEEIDDRYVIMNAGDELVLQAEELPDPIHDNVRTFIFESDGWVKDGDYNTGASATVHPLPSHGESGEWYGRELERGVSLSDLEEGDGEGNHSGDNILRPDGELFDDPVFRMHRHDWSRYHTRYITAQSFRSLLMPSASAWMPAGDELNQPETHQPERDQPETHQPKTRE